MQVIYKTDDGKVFESVQEALSWEKGKYFKLYKLKQEITEKSKKQYEAKRYLGCLLCDQKWLLESESSLKNKTNNMRSEVAHRSKSLTRLFKEYTQLKNN